MYFLNQLFIIICVRLTENISKYTDRKWDAPCYLLPVLVYISFEIFHL